MLLNDVEVEGIIKRVRSDYTYEVVWKLSDSDYDVNSVLYGELDYGY